MKILINAPKLIEPGGVANHYLGLKNYFSEKVLFNTIGTRMKIKGIWFLPFDLIKFFIKILFWNPDVIIINPSFANKALKRDAIYLNIASTLNKKVIVFFHGWDNEYQHLVFNNAAWFIKQYKHAHTFIVLAAEFKNALESLFTDVPIFLSTTKVDDKLLENFDISKKEYNNKGILYLARIEENKGIFELLAAFKELKKEMTGLLLIIAGSGAARQRAIEYVNKNSIQDVLFTGYISGEEKTRILSTSDIYVFPSYHGEGMPTSLLEAMAFGLPVITTTAGGIKDFFQNNRMGLICEPKNTNDLKQKISGMLKDIPALQKTGYNNYKYATAHFLASQVAKKLEDICKSVVNEK